MQTVGQGAESMRLFQPRMKVMESMRTIGSRGESVLEKIPGFRYKDLNPVSDMHVTIARPPSLQV